MSNIFVFSFLLVYPLLVFCCVAFDTWFIWTLAALELFILLLMDRLLVQFQCGCAGAWKVTIVAPKALNREHNLLMFHFDMFFQLPHVKKFTWTILTFILLSFFHTHVWFLMPLKATPSVGDVPTLLTDTCFLPLTMYPLLVTTETVQVGGCKGTCCTFEPLFTFIVSGFDVLFSEHWGCCKKAHIPHRHGLLSSHVHSLHGRSKNIFEMFERGIARN